MQAEKAADSQWAFDAYQSVRERLPQVDFDNTPQKAANLSAIADQIDVFLLDAFGVLNVGGSAIPGVPERIRSLQAAGKRVMVVSNAAGVPKRVLAQHYADLDYAFATEDIVTSREAMLAGLANQPKRRWGLIGSQKFGMEDFETLNAVFMADDPALYDQVDGFLFYGAGEWTESRQTLLENSLRRTSRPVLVGNPDIVAPVEGGLSRQAGHYAHRLADATGVRAEFFGKPFANIYDLVFQRLPAGIDRSRIVMVGDTLHTDILGGRVAGVKTALVTDFGSLTGTDIDACIQISGLCPDYTLPRP